MFFKNCWKMGGDSMMMFFLGSIFTILAFFAADLLREFFSELRNDIPRIGLEDYLALSEKSPDKWKLLSSCRSDVVESVHEPMSRYVIYFPNGYSHNYLIFDYCYTVSHNRFCELSAPFYLPEICIKDHILYRLSCCDSLKLARLRAKESKRIKEMEKNEILGKAHEFIQQELHQVE